MYNDNNCNMEIASICLMIRMEEWWCDFFSFVSHLVIYLKCDLENLLNLFSVSFYPYLPEINFIVKTGLIY